MKSKKNSKKGKLSFADRAKMIEKKYKSRADKGDNYAQEAMEKELTALFNEQETLKLTQQAEAQPTLMAYGGRMLLQEGGRLSRAERMALREEQRRLNSLFGATPEQLAQMSDPRGEYTAPSYGLNPTAKAYIAAGNESPVNPTDAAYGMDVVYKETVTDNRGRTSTTDLGKYNYQPGGFKRASDGSGDMTGDGAAGSGAGGSAKSRALTGADYLKYGTAAGTTALQMLNTSRPDRQAAYLDPFLQPFDRVRNTDALTQVTGNAMATREAMLNSGINNPGALLAVQDMANRGTSQVAQQDLMTNMGNEVTRDMTNNQIVARNNEKLYRRDSDYLQDQAAYEDMMNTYIGNMGQNVIGITSDAQNRKTVQNMPFNYGVGATYKAAYGGRLKYKRKRK